MKYLLDTDVCVHWLRGNESISQAIESHGLDNCCISEITKAELLFGEQLAISRGRLIKNDSLSHLFEVLEVIPISDTLEFYASEKARLSQAGIPIEDFDLLIACTAVTVGAILVTGNISHMQRVAGVRIEEWNLTP